MSTLRHAVATATDLACRAVGRRQVVLAPLGYSLGKLTPRGVEFYPGWDAELETFVEGNYVACVPPGSRASAVRRVVEICQLRNVR
jgi:hypothetical protein